MKQYKLIDTNALQFKNCCGMNFNGKDINRYKNISNDLTGLVDIVTFQNVIGDEVPLTAEEIRQQKITEDLNKVKAGYDVGGNIFQTILDYRDSIINPKTDILTTSTTESESDRLARETKEKKAKQMKVIAVTGVSIVAIGLIITFVIKNGNKAKTSK